jgi:deoxyribodipyrimidine photo-lyase
MTTHVVLFTRDLRVHDHPALHTAVQEADRVVPLFVLDDRILGSSYAAPNRCRVLLDGLADLRRALRDRGGDLVLRRGHVAEEVRGVVDRTGAVVVHVTRDVSAYARRREQDLGRALEDTGAEVVTHPGHLLVEPGEVTPTGGDHFKVFTPYWRRWKDAAHRPALPAPDAVRLPTIARGAVPDLADVVDGEPSPDLEAGGETAARERLAWWLDGPIADYEESRNRLADAQGTSRLSTHLHFGTIGVAEIADGLDLRRAGHEGFLQELCWREFNHQLLAATPSLPREDYRTRHDDWRDDDEAFAAWCDGRTGYPVVDAGMRQLRREGYMHNRARMITASFLTKHLYIDWRRGAAHFAHWLADGDLANNWGQWQWVAGTGTDSRPNRMFNPMTQSKRYDPDGTYVRRYVDELADVDDDTVHAPWEAQGSLLEATDYPPPIVDHREARDRFLAARGAG